MPKVKPIPEDLRAIANDIAETLSGALPPGVGFALLMFDFGEGGTMSYISNGKREEMVAAMKELLYNMGQEK